MGLFDDTVERLALAADGAASLLRGAEDVPFESMYKSLDSSGLAVPTRETSRAMFHDPYSVQDWGGWRERPSVLTYESLRRLSTQNTVIAAIIQTRVNQVAAFSRPQQGRYDKGYKVILRDRRDNKRKMSPAEERQATEIERMIETTGFLLPEEKPSDRDSFRDFMKKSVRDILVYDQWTWEKIRDRRGRISRFQCLPAHTMRPAVNDTEHMQPEERRERVSHVQVYEDTVIAEFSPDDIAWCVSNPRSDIRANGFGFSPVEQLTNVITSWLYGFEYNTKFFTQGSAIKGVLNVKGAIPDRQLKAFRRMWYSMVSGVGNAWRTPILNAEDLQWTSMHSNNREMEFGAWMDWLTKITCAVFGIDPVEINFIFGASGVTSSLNQTSPNEQQVTESKDKGLRPVMEHVADSLNKHFIWEVNPDFEFSFVGLDAQGEDAERAAMVQEVKHFRTVNEVRAVYDLDPLDDGDIILDPVYQQHASGGEEGGMDGGPLDEHDDDGDDDDDEEAWDGDDDESDTGEEDTPDSSETEAKGSTEGGSGDFGKSLALLEEVDALHKSMTRTIHGGHQIFEIKLGD